MNMRSLFIGVGALFIAVIAAIVARNMFATSSVQQVQAQPVKVEPKTKIMVAAKALPMGTILKPEDVKYAEWPEEATDATFYRDGAAIAGGIAGKVVKVAVMAGQPVSSASIVGPGERGFLAAVLRPGMRAVSVSVNPTSGVAGFLFPGDRVDVLLTNEITGQSGLQVKGSETILENVRIIAVDQTTNDTDRIAGLRSTVTFEVQPKYVELINVARRLGEISLSLRPLAQTDEEKLALAGKVDPVTGKPIVSADGKDVTADQEPMMPPLSQRSLTIDKEFSQLVSLAKRPESGGAAGGAAAAPAAKPVGDGSVRPDLTISRGNAQEPVSFKLKISNGAAPQAAAPAANLQQDSAGSMPVQKPQ